MHYIFSVSLNRPPRFDFAPSACPVFLDTSAIADIDFRRGVVTLPSGEFTLDSVINIARAAQRWDEEQRQAALDKP